MRQESDILLAEKNELMESSQHISAEIRHLFSLATFIDLEPGMSNEFSEGLDHAIEHYGKQALRAIEDIVLSGKTKSAIAMEALQYVGSTDSSLWHNERRKTLERCLLESASAWVRDGAGLGLASLDDPRSLQSVELAILNEPSEVLKDNLMLVRDQLLDSMLDS